MFMVDSSVLNDVQNERKKQDEKWGEQNHPDYDEVHDYEYWVGTSNTHTAKSNCSKAVTEKRLTWFHIHVEEMAEAMDEAQAGDLQKLRTELVQLAATVVAHIEAIDRRRK